MNTHLRTMAAAALLAALVPAQTTDAARALARARVIEEQEGDLKEAESAYRTLLGDAAASAVHGEAALRLGAMLWRLDKKDDGKPFLERAVAAGGDVAAQATAVLQGQSEAGKQAQERREKARALVNRIDDLSWKPRDANGQLDEGTTLALRDLKWLGEDAASALVERLDPFHTLEEGGLSTGVGQPVPNLSLLVGTLWEVGTAPALQFLTRAADDKNVAWRRFITKHAGLVAPDLMPALVRFLRDADPTGEVPRNLNRVLWSVPVPTLVELVGDDHPGARAAGLAGLAEVWHNLPVPEQARIVEVLDVAVRRALRDSEPRAAHAAWQLVSRFAMCGPRAARRLVLGEVARYPDGIEAFGADLEHLSWPLDDAEIDLLLAACRALKSPSTQQQTTSSYARIALQMVFSRHLPEWSARSVDSVLELLELGYGGDNSAEPNCVRHLFASMNATQLERFVRVMPKLARTDLTFGSLSKADLTPAVFPALREVIDSDLRGSPRNWPGDSLSRLLWNVGRTGAPEAATWLTEFVDRVPGSSTHVARALLELGRTVDAETVRVGLRKLLVAPDAADVRSELFAELARLGDEPSIALFPRAYALGLGGYNAPAARRRGLFSQDLANEQPLGASGIGFLGLTPAPTNQQRVAWHGYSDAQLVQAWSALLSCEARDKVWSEIQRMSERIPVPVMPLLASELPALWAKLPAEQRSSTINTVLHTFGSVTVDQVAAGSSMRSAIESLLRANDFDLAAGTLIKLPNKVAPEFADDALALLRRATSPGYFAPFLKRAGIDLRTEDWQLALRDKNPSNRMGTLYALPAPLDPKLQQDVEALLRDDPTEEVRTSAANTLARVLAMDAVTPLLEALRDPSATVRKAATEALERFRFQQEQQAFWANAKAGIDTSPSSAAAKLLAQAKPGEAKDQRLLAIRSLGALGAPESLPYLIEWTKDADAEIAAASRAAVAKIHETAGAKK
ncbi:MAG TPA: HEAT repeat domain-containing protein [Planctomycetota bacterium]|nr:HEAT repeat domain-containing protein [Planctomycetota bacterium]